MNVNVISVDPGLNRTGVFMAIEGKPTSASFKKDGPRYTSLGRLFFWMRETIEQRSPNEPRPAEEWPKIAFVEDYPYHMKNSATLTICAETGGTVRAALGSLGIPVVAVNIKTWKRLTIGDHPKETKQQQEHYLDVVFQRYGREFESTDEADAYLIYRAAQLIWKGEGGDGKQVVLVRRMIDEALQLPLLEATA